MTEIIVAAAVSRDGIVAFAPSPGRHHTVLHALAAIGAQTPVSGKQGFVTSTGRFVDREEGWRIAEAAGQIIARCGADTTDGGTLYSENLW